MIPGVTKETTRKPSLNLIVTADLKRQVEEYAQRMGLTLTAASIMLLHSGLRAERSERASEFGQAS